jgi:hypothetical protein
MADPQFAPPQPPPLTPSAPPAPPPTLGTPASWDDVITGIAKKYQVDPRLALAVAKTESSMNPAAVSRAGARGIMQLMPETAARHQVNVNDPADVVRGGVEELRDLLNTHNNDVVMALRRYNASPTAPREATDPYVQKVLGMIKPSTETPAPGTTPATTPTTPTAPTTPPTSWDIFSHEATKGLRDLWGAAKAGVVAAGRGADTFLRDPEGSSVAAAKAVGHGAVDASNAVGWALEHPTDTAHKLFDTSTGRVRAAADRAAQAFQGGLNEPPGRGRLPALMQGGKEVGNTLLEAVNVPLDLMGGLGTRLSEGEQNIREGKYAEGAGKVTDVAAQTLGPEVLGKYGLPIPLRFKPHLLPEQQAAVDLLTRGGVKVDLGTTTGNRVARALQQHAESTLAGGGIGLVAKNERARAVANLGQRMADQVYPAIVTPGEAGIALRQGTSDAASALSRQASTAYDTVDRLAADPAHLHTVQTGTAPPPFYPPGQPRVPIFEPIQVPTDLRQVKAALQPIRDEIVAQMPLGQQQYSKGLQALDNVLALRDFEPVGTVEKNLGALKRAARGFDHPAFRSLEQGTAGIAVNEVSQAVDAAMATLGPQAQAALAEARGATKAKYAIEDLVDSMNKEKVQAFDTAVGTGDRHVEGLQELARVAPQTMPQVGRAVLDKIFEHATGLEKGWSREAGAARMWESLGPETKQILFGNRTRDLDRFFLGQKMLAASANPSMTSFSLSSLWSTLAAFGGSPFTAAAPQVAGGLFSALANSKGGVRFLTQGLRIPPGDTTRLTAWAVAAANRLHQTGDLPSQVGRPPTPPPGAPTPPPGPPPSVETNPEAR